MKGRIVSIVVLMAVLLSLCVGCSSSNEAKSFSLVVIPSELKGFSISGQKVVYLVSITDDEGSGPVELSAEGTNCTIEIFPEAIEGEFAEVVVIPTEDSVDGEVTVEIKAVRDGWEETAEVSFGVVPGEDDRGTRAKELLDMFIPWLAENVPELGITEDTVWEGTMVSPQWLVVSHYLFFSEKWEIHIAWHNMIPPYDWVRIDLRERFKEDAPSYSFEIPSVTAEDEPVEYDIPEEIWR